MVSEIWSTTDIIFCPSGPFFTLLPPIDPENQNFQKNKKNGKKHPKILTFYKHKYQSYDGWFFRYAVQQTEFFVILEPATWSTTDIFF